MFHALAVEKRCRRVLSRAPAQRQQAAKDAKGRQVQAAGPAERVRKVQRHARRCGTQRLRKCLQRRDRRWLCYYNMPAPFQIAPTPPSRNAA